MILQRAEKDYAEASTREEALKAALEAATHLLDAIASTHSTCRDERRRLEGKARFFLGCAEKIKTQKIWPLGHAGGYEEREVVMGAHRTEPLSTRSLSRREQIILLEDSKLNGNIFAPWEGGHVDEQEFLRPPAGDELFE